MVKTLTQGSTPEWRKRLISVTFATLYSLYARHDRSGVIGVHGQGADTHLNRVATRPLVCFTQHTAHRWDARSAGCSNSSAPLKVAAPPSRAIRLSEEPSIAKRRISSFSGRTHSARSREQLAAA